jgi:hypothetical protein
MQPARARTDDILPENVQIAHDSKIFNTINGLKSQELPLFFMELAGLVRFLKCLVTT